jgi:hypothetical protein
MLCREKGDLGKIVKRSSKERLTSWRIVVMPSVFRPVAADGTFIGSAVR